jgi:hypothetical protein
MYPKEEDVDYLFGRPKVTKPNVRDPNLVIPQLSNQFEFYAKKMREQYLREGVLPSYSPTLPISRERKPEDLIEKLLANQEVACVIEGRDEFEDIDLVMPFKSVHYMKRQDHHPVRTFKINLEDREEEVTVSLKELKTHPFNGKFLKIVF